MADIFGGVEPPAWLSRMTAQRPGELGQIVGELVGGFATSAEVAIDKADKKTQSGEDTNWIKEMPGSIQQGFFEARMNLNNPMWKQQAQQAQLNMVQQGLAMQNTQSLIRGRAQTLQMQQHDQEVLPAWLAEHPTWESRQDAAPPVLFTPQAQKSLRELELNDNASANAKVRNGVITTFQKGLQELQKLDATNPALGALSGIGNKVPTAQQQAQLNDALGKAQTKKKTDEETPKIVEQTFADGTTIKGIQIGKTFHQFKDQKAAPAKLSPAQSSELIYARERALAAERRMGDPALSPAQKEEAEKQYIIDRKFYNQKLKEVEESTATPTQRAPAAPAPAPAPAAPPSVSAGNNGGISFDDFTNWMSR